MLSMTSVKTDWEDNTTLISTFYPTMTVYGQLFHLICPSQDLPGYDINLDLSLL